MSLLRGVRVGIAGDALVGRVTGQLLAEAGATVADSGPLDAAVDVTWCAGRPDVSAPIRVVVETGLALQPEGLSESELEDRVAAKAGVFATAVSGQGGDGVAYIDVPVASVSTAVQIVTAIAAARYASGPRQIRALLTRTPAFHKGTEFSESEHLATVRATQMGASGLYRAVDGRWIQLDAPSTRITTRLWRVLDSAGFSSPALEALLVALPEVTPRAAQELRSALCAVFATRPGAEWERLLSSADVPCALCRTRAEWQVSARRAPALTFAPAPGRVLRPPDRPPRVLDLSTIIAGPACARTLAALGFDVIKIDEPGERPLWFPHLHIDAHRGKRHLVLDLRSAAGRAEFLELVDASDVIVENARPGVWDRLGLGFAELRARRPSLVIASVRLYGPGSADEGWPGYETTAQAVSGLMERFALGDGVPRRAGGGAINDYAAGSLAAFGVLSALAGGQPGHVVATLSGAASLFVDACPAVPRDSSNMPADAVNDMQLRQILIAEDRYRYADHPGWGRVGHVGYAVDFDPPLVDAWKPAPQWNELSAARPR